MKMSTVFFVDMVVLSQSTVYWFYPIQFAYLCTWIWLWSGCRHPKPCCLLGEVAQDPEPEYVLWVESNSPLPVIMFSERFVVDLGFELVPLFLSCSSHSYSMFLAQHTASSICLAVACMWFGPDAESIRQRHAHCNLHSLGYILYFFTIPLWKKMLLEAIHEHPPLSHTPTLCKSKHELLKSASEASSREFRWYTSMLATFTCSGFGAPDEDNVKVLDSPSTTSYHNVASVESFQDISMTASEFSPLTKLTRLGRRK